MKSRLESLKPKDARTLALEAAALGIAAWRLKVKRSQRKSDEENLDSKSKLSSAPAHMIYPIEDGSAFVYPGQDSTIVGLFRTHSNPIEIKVGHRKENSDGGLVLQDLTTEDIPTIELLINSFQNALSGLQGDETVEQ